MFGIHDFGLFLATGILLNLAPGPDTAYIVGRSIAQGRAAGIASALGISRQAAARLADHPCDRILVGKVLEKVDESSTVPR